MAGNIRILQICLNIVIFIGLLGAVTYFANSAIVKFENGAKDFTSSDTLHTELDSPTFVFCIQPSGKESIIKKYQLKDEYFTIFSNIKDENSSEQRQSTS